MACALDRGLQRSGEVDGWMNGWMDVWMYVCLILTVLMMDSVSISKSNTGLSEEQLVRNDQKMVKSAVEVKK